jgi:hypothetical protein
LEAAGQRGVFVFCPAVVWEMDLNISLCDAQKLFCCLGVIFSQVNINLSPLYRNVFRRDQRRFEFVTVVFPARLSAPTDGGVIHIIFL